MIKEKRYPLVVSVRRKMVPPNPLLRGIVTIIFKAALDRFQQGYY